ncbi:MAG: class I SAM-dependent methyltransferase [Hyphomicrobiaceae bacterium]
MVSAGAGASDAARAMDAIYRSQRHIYDLTRKYYLLGRDRLIAELDPPTGGHVLELGCGTGRNLVLAARRHTDAQLHGIDISQAMLETAAASIKRAGLDRRIRLAAGDASSVDTAAAFGLAHFERVFISYSLSMIPPWRETVGHALSLLAPRGSLHIVDFGDQAELPGWFRSGLRAWLAKFHVEPRADLRDVLAREAATRGLDLRFERLYRDYAQYAVLTRRA